MAAYETLKYDPAAATAPAPAAGSAAAPGNGNIALDIKQPAVVPATNTGYAAPAQTQAPGGADYVTRLKRYAGPNPFVSRTPVTAGEVVKIVLMSPIALVRLLVIIACVLLQWLLSLPATVCVDARRPFSGWRTVWVYPIRFLFRIIMLAAGFWWISVTDHRTGPRKSNLFVVAPHQSMWDMFKLVYDEGVAGAGKAELFNMPLLGRILRALQCVPVGRESGDGRKAALQAITERATNQQYPPLVIFPQGTTTNDRVLTTFKRGAFAARAPVTPVLLRYPNAHYDLYLDASAFGCLWRSLCQVVNYMHVEYLAEYVPSDAEKADDALYASNVRRVMAEALGVAWVTEHEWADLRLAVDASRAGVNVDFVLQDVAAKLHAKYDDIKLLMHTFRTQAPGGKMTLHDFAKAIGLKETSDNTKRLFALLDTDSSGNLDFGEFVVAMSLVSRNCSPLDSARLLFEVIDLNGDRFITRDELARALALAHDVTSPVAHTQVEVERKAAADAARRAHGKPTTVAAAPAPAPAPAPLQLKAAAVKELSDSDVVAALFAGGEERISYDTFVTRLTAPGQEAIQQLLNLFLWKRVAPQAPSPLAARKA